MTTKESGWPSSAEPVEEYDLLGIGYGPANLALNVALTESHEAQQQNLRFHFVERQARFGWHSSLLLPGAQLQVSPMKDLATMRDPTSSFTFANYLHQQGRLASFINREASIPSRRDWSAYLHWAAKRLEKYVTYGQEVVSVELDRVHPVRRFRVTLRDVASGNVTFRWARNITVAVGGVPNIAPVMEATFASHSDVAVHSSTYLPSLAKMEPRLRQIEAKRLAVNTEKAPLRFAVMGAGQSAAEISLHLRNTFPNAHVSLIFRTSALVPSDDSAFVNAAAFDPERTDAFWRAGEEERLAWLAEYRRTNYSVVRSDVLNAVHTMVYDQQIELSQPFPHADGPPKRGMLELMPNTQIETVHITPDAETGQEVVDLSLRNLKYPVHGEHDPDVRSFDAVFMATGFRRGPHCLPFLQPLQKYYPRLDADADTTRAELGFGEEAESMQTLSNLQGDEMAAEKLRMRTRGISRDYRLVSYSSGAFDAAPASASPLPSPKASGTSGTSTPAGETESSDSSTLADEQDDHARNTSPSRRTSEPLHELRGPPIEAGIYFMGGNEATHGLSDSLLSIVAYRSGELVESLTRRHGTMATGAAKPQTSGMADTTSHVRQPTKALLDTMPVETIENKVRSMGLA